MDRSTTKSQFHGTGAAFAACLSLALVGSGSAFGSERIVGPVEARLVRVIDGDTLEVRARIWPGLEVTVAARIRGIDTPELRGKCPAEKAEAAKAAAVLAEEIRDRPLRLTNIEEGKWAGRVVADVSAADGRDLGALMLARGLARPYDGGRRDAWCAVSAGGS